MFSCNYDIISRIGSHSRELRFPAKSQATCTSTHYAAATFVFAGETFAGEWLGTDAGWEQVGSYLGGLQWWVGARSRGLYGTFVDRAEPRSNFCEVLLGFWSRTLLASRYFPRTGRLADLPGFYISNNPTCNKCHMLSENLNFSTAASVLRYGVASVPGKGAGLVINRPIHLH